MPCCLYADVYGYRAAIRIESSSRIVPPLSIGLVMMASTGCTHSDGAPSRLGCGTCASSDSWASSGSEASSAVLRTGRDHVDADLPSDSPRVIGSSMPTMPPLDVG
jgi:hypothetical protein